MRRSDLGILALALAVGCLLGWGISGILYGKTRAVGEGRDAAAPDGFADEAAQADAAGLPVAPPNALAYEIAARRSGYVVTHPGGAALENEIRVPIHTPVRLRFATDEGHEFACEPMAMRRAVKAGEPLVLWFEATRLGTWPFQARGFDGDRSIGFTGAVVVVPDRAALPGR